MIEIKPIEEFNEIINSHIGATDTKDKKDK